MLAFSLRPFGAVVSSRSATLADFGGETLSGLLREHRLVVFRGLNTPSREELLSFCLSYPRAKLLHWENGPVMEMRAEEKAKNYLFSRERVPFHWDGAFHQVPSYLVFHCLEAPPSDSGGETLFCSTERIWEEATLEERSLWSRITLTYHTEKLAHYGGKFTTSLVDCHPKFETPILRFAESVETALNPVALEVEGVTREEAASFLWGMRKKIYSPRYCYSHTWEKGDLLIADNHALIHGRNAFVTDSPRHLRRVQIL